jgi:hypothetical protein
MTFTGVLGLLLVFGAAEARADEMSGDSNKPKIFSIYGASLSVGGGVTGFADDAMRDFANVGGAWDARLVFGTRAPVGIEAAYIGGATPVDALGLDDNAALVSGGVEVLGRVNLMETDWQPYAVAGIGWQHYSVVNSDRNTSSVANDDDIGEVPMGAGVAYRYRGLVVDARGLYRLAFNDDLIQESPGEEKANLHSWQAQLTAGWEF